MPLSTTSRRRRRMSAKHFERRGISDGVEGADDFGFCVERDLPRVADAWARSLQKSFHCFVAAGIRLFSLSWIVGRRWASISFGIGLWLRLGLGFALRFRDPHVLGALGAVGEHRPRRLGPAATLAHMLERCLLGFRVRLGGASAEELQIGAADHRPGQAYSAWSLVGCSACSGCSSLEEPAASAARIFTAAILPRRSCSRS